MAFQYLKGTHRDVGEGVFTRACNERGNEFKLEEISFRLDIRKNFLTARVLRHWHRFPREAVDAPPGKCSRTGRMGV